MKIEKKIAKRQSFSYCLLKIFVQKWTESFCLIFRFPFLLYIHFFFFGNNRFVNMFFSMKIDQFMVTWTLFQGWKKMAERDSVQSISSFTNFMKISLTKCLNKLIDFFSKNYVRLKCTWKKYLNQCWQPKVGFIYRIVRSVVSDFWSQMNFFAFQFKFLEFIIRLNLIR